MSLLPAGVPVLQDALIIFDKITLVAADALLLINALTSKRHWGIFDKDGNAVLTGDSVFAFDFTRDSSIAKYPVEKGDFASYNKVQVPFGIKLTFTKGGDVGERALFLKKVDQLQATTTLYTVITPELNYSNVNITHYDFRRTSQNGVTLLVVDVWCEQVRQSAPLQFSQTDTPSTTAPVTAPANPESASPVNSGPVQGSAPAPQTTTPSGPTAAFSGGGGQPSPFAGASGSWDAPPTVSAPGVSLTNGVGNVPSASSATNSLITYGTPNGPASSLVSGVITNPSTGLPIEYGTLSGSVPINQVTHIVSPGQTVVK